MGTLAWHITLILYHGAEYSERSCAGVKESGTLGTIIYHKTCLKVGNTDPVRVYGCKYPRLRKAHLPLSDSALLWGNLRR